MDDELSRQDLLLINQLCDEFEQQWQLLVAADSVESTQPPSTEVSVMQVPERLRPQAIQELIGIEIEYRLKIGEMLTPDEFVRRFPDVDVQSIVDQLRESVPDVDDSSHPMKNSMTVSGDNEQTSAAPSQTLPQVIGQYEIIGVLGVGGMGTVYHAIHREMRRDVALKTMRPELVNSETMRERFRREVLAAAQLIHPNIVTAYDAGDDHGTPFLVSEYIRGMDLDRWVKQHGPLTPQMALQSTMDAADGLAYAHQHNIVHRDIKPANLLLDDSGVVRILDMGLARFSMQTPAGFDSHLDESELTKSGMVMGTASYMAPEQARHTRNADARSDIYSLGCVLYYLLEGRPPYRGESAIDTMLAHATEPLPILSRAADNAIKGQRATEYAQLQELIRHMMAKPPEDRPQTMQQVIRLLDQCKNHTYSSGFTSSSIVLDPRATANHESMTSAEDGKMSHRKSFIVAAIAIVLLALIGYGFGSRSSEQTEVSVSNPDAGGTLGVRPQSRSVNQQPQLVNRAVSFNGRNSYIEVPSILHGPQDEVTIEIIVRLDETRTANAVSWLGEHWMAVFQNQYWGVCRKQGSNSLFAVCRSERADVSQAFHHVAGTWDGMQLRLFVDGHNVPVGSIPFDLGETQPGLFIGGVDPNRLPSGQNMRFFTGAIDALRISEAVLYKEGQSFRAPTRLEKRPKTLVLMQFNEPVGASEFRDESGNGHHGRGHHTVSITR